jgi:hypothetical protein
MKRYTVTFEQIITRTVTIEAETAYEAETAVNEFTMEDFKLGRDALNAILQQKQYNAEIIAVSRESSDESVKAQF